MYIVPQRTPAPYAGPTPPARLAQFIEEKKSPEDAEKTVRIPERKRDAQTNVANGEDGQRVGHRPKTTGEKRPNNKVRRAADVGADRRSAEDQSGEAPARQKNADDHDERNHHRGDSDGDELRWRFRRAQPGARGEAGKDAEHLQLSRARRVLDCCWILGRQCGFHGPPAEYSVNEPQKEKTADQHCDGNPEMNVGEHDRHPVPRLIRSAVFLHPDSSEAPDSRTPGGFAAHDTIGKAGILLREKDYP